LPYGRTTERERETERKDGADDPDTGLALSLKMEKHLDALISADQSHRTSQSLSNAHSGEAAVGTTQYGIQYQNRDGDESVIWGAGGRGHLPGTPRSSGAFIGAQGTATPIGAFPSTFSFVFFSISGEGVLT